MKIHVFSVSAIMLFGLLIVPLTARSDQTLVSACGIPVMDSDKNPELIKKIMRAFENISKIKGSGSSPLHQEIFGGHVDGKVYCNYLGRRITKIHVVDVEIAHTMRFSLVDHSVAVDPSQVAISDLEMMMSFFHEAAHSKYIHHPCPPTCIDPVTGDTVANSWRGLMGCDVHEKGANGASIVWLVNMGWKCTNCPKELFKTSDMVNTYFYQGFVYGQTRLKIAEDINLILPQNKQINLQSEFYK